MVTEIMGGTHIVRPSDPAENEPKAEKTTMIIMNNIPEVRLYHLEFDFFSTSLPVMLHYTTNLTLT
jgi:hypothetical protein